MPEFAVIEKATGREVYRYVETAPVEWVGMKFATHDHIEVAAPVAEPVIEAIAARVWTKLEYLRRFTQEERITIREAAKTSAPLADYLELLALAEEIRSDDPDIAAALAFLESSGLIAAGRAREILHD